MIWDLRAPVRRSREEAADGPREVVLPDQIRAFTHMARWERAVLQQDHCRVAMRYDAENYSFLRSICVDSAVAARR